MISFSEHCEREKREFLTPEQERELFCRRDLLLESMNASRVPESRKVQLQKEINLLVRGIPTETLRQRVDDLAEKISHDQYELSYCSDDLSLTVIYMTIQEHFLPLAQKLSKSHLFPGVEKRDLWHRAVIGLQEAIRKYKPSNLSFGRYASWIIRNSLKEELQMTMGPLRMPKLMVEHYRSITKAYNDHWQEHHEIPTSVQLASRADTGKSAARAFLMSRQQTAMVHESHAIECDDPQVETARRDISRIVRAMVEAIEDEKSRNVLAMYFGVGLDRPYTLQEIAEKLGYKSRINIFQIKEKALSELRKKFSHLQNELNDIFCDHSTAKEASMIAQPALN